MGVDCSDPVKLFREDFPREFLAGVVRLLHAVYVESLSLMTGELSEEEISAAWGVFRRAKIEGELRRLAGRHGFKAFPERNDTGSVHTVVESEIFCLTESRVATAGRLPARARFRDQQALNNTPLFAGLELDELPADKKFSAVLIHGPSRSNRSRLGFIMIRFPNVHGTRWLDASINLLEEFPQPDAADDEFREEVIPRPLDPQIRDDVEGTGSK
jgi:hypothetical protein